MSGFDGIFGFGVDYPAFHCPSGGQIGLEGKRNSFSFTELGVKRFRRSMNGSFIARAEVKEVRDGL
ncbi:hypothetical protein [Neobacillus cucumis]|uniref:hypothetical protein n=1 Tax=Neobacillus cucumis TaxID=1740721 RepID=UPI0028531146|nr:hypothetical protein [Neobacillus cucumis]MDR4947588.1 hypothetical protein [Neobacillus cucumis]